MLFRYKATVITTPWDELDGNKILETIENAKDLEAELMAEVAKLHDAYHHDHEGHECHHHEGHDHDEHECHHDHEGHDHDEHECHHDHEGHDHDEHECHHDHEGHECHHHEGHDHDEHECHYHEGHDHHGEDCTCGCHDHHHGHHHADDIFTSWGFETPTAYTRAEIEQILEALEDEKKYGSILRAKGMVFAGDGTWLNFDYVPGESNVRAGAAEVTGKICVIGAQLNEENLKALFAK